MPTKPATFPGVTITQVMLTPTMAQQFLNKNHPHNRKPSPEHVAVIAKDIAGGRWLFEGSPIRFDTTGCMIDGQSRCLAVIKANKAVPLAVVRGLAPEAFDIIDRTTKLRSFTEILATRNYSHTHNLATGLYLYTAFLGGMGLRRQKTSPALLLETLEANLGLSDSCNFVHDVGKLPLQHLVSMGAITAFHYIFSQINKPLADELVKGLSEPTGFKGPLTRPFNNLKHKLHSQQVKMSNTRRRIEQMHFIIQAWNAEMKGKPTCRFSYKEGDSLPDIEGLQGKPTQP